MSEAEERARGERFARMLPDDPNLPKRAIKNEVERAAEAEAQKVEKGDLVKAYETGPVIDVLCDCDLIKDAKRYSSVARNTSADGKYVVEGEALDEPKVFAVGEFVCIRVMEPPQDPSPIVQLSHKGRSRRGIVISIGSRVTDVRVNRIVEFDPYKLRAVYGKDGWRGASSEVGHPGDLALLHFEDVLIEVS